MTSDCTLRGMFDRLDYRHSTRGRQLVLAVGFTCLLTGYLLVRVSFTLLPARKPDLTPIPEPEAEFHAPAPHILPPLYSSFHTSELQLPQQDWSRTHPTEDEKFLFVAGHTRGLGWGNAVQEHILNAYLAYKSGRTFVFGNFTWNDDGSLWSDYEGTGKMIPSQIPYSVLIQGPMVGDRFPSGDNAPRAVTRTYFDHVCPHKMQIDRGTVHSKLSSQTSAWEITEKWISALDNTNEPCVQSTQSSGPIYTHHHIFGVRTSLLALWPDLKRSPIITHFGWSPLVELAFDMNRDLLLPQTSDLPYLSSNSYTTNTDRYTEIPGLMVIHVRRGDYEMHCRTLALLSEDFVSVNAFPGLPDPFTVPPHEEYGNNTPENIEIYRKRCLPTLQEIAAKVAEVRASPAAHGVRRLYIMTNGRPDYVRELKDALWSLGGWDMIASSRDLVLNWEQKFVSQAVDMLVAQRAQVLLGNGFSTLTSNAVTMRLANDLPIDSIRFL
ncbi:hypothetical protein BC628DRAFT_1359061 [Trametes gibbosa]|nr:hypothetical protein BC628DRAFT_1359061 [Trametes gibbosa]